MNNLQSTIFQEVRKVLNEDIIFKENAQSYFRILENSLQRSPKAVNISKLIQTLFNYFSG